MNGGGLKEKGKMPHQKAGGVLTAFESLHCIGIVPPGQALIRMVITYSKLYGGKNRIATI
jgi:hypothetical protein